MVSLTRLDNEQRWQPFLIILARVDEQMCLSLILSYVSENGAAFPIKIGDDYTKEQKNMMALYLIKTHFADFKSSHCTPLPGDFFKAPWKIPQEDFVFT